MKYNILILHHSALNNKLCCIGHYSALAVHYMFDRDRNPVKSIKQDIHERKSYSCTFFIKLRLRATMNPCRLPRFMFARGRNPLKNMLKIQVHKRPSYFCTISIRLHLRTNLNPCRLPRFMFAGGRIPLKNMSKTEVHKSAQLFCKGFVAICQKCSFRNVESLKPIRIPVLSRIRDRSLFNPKALFFRFSWIFFFEKEDL